MGIGAYKEFFQNFHRSKNEVAIVWNYFRKAFVWRFIKSFLNAIFETQSLI